MQLSYDAYVALGLGGVLAGMMAIFFLWLKPEADRLGHLIERERTEKGEDRA